MVPVNSSGLSLSPMANTESLRDLQERLDNRLRSAKTDVVSVSWLAIRSPEHNYLLPLGQLGEVFPMADFQPVPYTAVWFLGVVNLRGGLFGMIDLDQFINARDVPAQSVQPGRGSSLVTLNSVLEVNCALCVDELAGLRNTGSFAAVAPSIAGAPAYFGTRFEDEAGAHWQEINLQTMSRSAEFLTISA
jgi:twitching motility protein PilI